MQELNELKKLLAFKKLDDVDSKFVKKFVDGVEKFQNSREEEISSVQHTDKTDPTKKNSAAKKKSAQATAIKDNKFRKTIYRDGSKKEEAPTSYNDVNKATQEDEMGSALKQLAQKFFGQEERLEQIEKSLAETPKLIPGKVTGKVSKTTASHALSKGSFSQVSESLTINLMEKTQRPLPKSELWKDRTWHLPERYKYFTGRKIFLERMRKQLETGDDKQCVLTVTSVKKQAGEVTKIEKISTLSRTEDSEDQKNEVLLSNTSSANEQEQKGKTPRVTGPGGIGKTVLAVEYAYQALKHKAYQHVIWLDASQDLSGQYRDLARYLGIPFDSKTKTAVVIERVYRRLSNPQNKESAPKILLIFDNAQSLIVDKKPEQSLKGFLPPNAQKEQFSVLITSRNDQSWGNDFARYRLDVFTEEESVEYIQKLLTQVSQEEAKTLAKLVSCYPLVLSQAVAYIKHSPQKMTVAAYIEAYKTKKKALLDTNEAKTLLKDPYQLTLWLTLGFSIQAIENEEAHKLLHYCSYLHSRGIPKFLLKSLLGEGKKWKEMDKTLTTLHDYSLLTQAGRGQVQVHAMVQSILQLMHENTRRSGLLTQLSQTLTDEFDKEKKLLEKEQRENVLKAHLEQVLIHFDNRPTDKSVYNLSLMRLLEAIGEHDLKHSRARRAQIRLARLKSMLEALGSHVEDMEPFQNIIVRSKLASTLNNLAIAYCDLGDVKTMKTLLERALHVKKTLPGESDLAIAISSANLANVYGVMGDAKTKKTLLERALPIMEAHYGKDHWQVATVLGGLATAYCDLGNVKMMKTLLERTLHITKAYYGEAHWRVAIVLGNLANAYGALGDTKSKKALLEKALLIKEEHFGKSHWQVANTLINLANAYGALGDANVMKILLERTISIREAFYGKNHWQVAVALDDLASTYDTLGDTKTKKTLLKCALHIKEKHFGKTHWQVANTLINLANAYGTLGDAKKKKILLERALPIIEAHYGQGHWRVATTLNDLAEACGSLGDANAMRAYLERAWSIMEVIYGQNHWKAAGILVNLGDVYLRLGDVRLAKPLLERALPILEAYYGKTHWRTAIALFNLAKVHIQLGDIQSGLSQLRTAYQHFLTGLGPQHPHTLTAKRTLDRHTVRSGEGEVAFIFDTIENAKAFSKSLAHYNIGEKTIVPTEENNFACLLTLDECNLLQKSILQTNEITTAPSEISVEKGSTNQTTLDSSESDSEDEEQLTRALTLSNQLSPSKTSQSEIKKEDKKEEQCTVDKNESESSDSEEDEDFKRAMAMSLGK